jgi:Glucodextranase, domain N
MLSGAAAPPPRASRCACSSCGSRCPGRSRGLRSRARASRPRKWRRKGRSGSSWGSSVTRAHRCVARRPISTACESPSRTGSAGAMARPLSTTSPGLRSTVEACGEASTRHGVLALGFAYTPSGAYTRARTALAADFDTLRSDFLQAWRAWGATLSLPRPDETLGDAAEFSATSAHRGPVRRAYPGWPLVGGARPRAARASRGAELHATPREWLGERRPCRRARSPSGGCLAPNRPGGI